MVTREPGQGNQNQDTAGSSSETTSTHGTGYNRQPGDANVGITTSTYSPHGEVSGYSASASGTGSTGSAGTSGASGETGSGSGSGGSDMMSGADSESGSSMKDRATDMAGSAKDAASTAKDRAGEMAGTARERAGEAVSTATQSIDAQRDTVAGSLDTVASTLRDKAEVIPGGEKTTQIAQNAAERIETASTYLRDKEVTDMMTDVQVFVRSHPTESMVIALAAGFLLGRAIRN